MYIDSVLMQVIGPVVITYAKLILLLLMAFAYI